MSVYIFFDFFFSAAGSPPVLIINLASDALAIASADEIHGYSPMASVFLLPFKTVTQAPHFLTGRSNE